MKKDCWSILGIARTRDVSIIKKAYRGLIKLYHPDTVQAPEKKRKYTIKCVEIIRAYKEAMVYAQTFQPEPEISTQNEQTVLSKAAPAKGRENVFIKVLGGFVLLLFFVPFVFILMEVLHIYPAFTKSMNLIFNGYSSMPLNSPFKMIISFPLALLLGWLICGVISLFTSAPVIYLWGVLSNTKYEEYMYKVGFVIIAGLNILIVYFVPSLHWPFEHRVNGYYNFLYHLCRFLSCSSGPLYLLANWILDNLKYLRIKNSFFSSELVLYKQDEV